MSQALFWIDGKWQSLEVDNADNLDGKDSLDFSLANHKHFKSEITDLPGNVTTAQDGFMSVADKVKLNNIAENANNYSHPTSSGNKHIPSGGSSGQILCWSSDGTATWGADNNITYDIVTTSTNGLMSSTDKSKLDTIAINANNYSHPSYHAASIIAQDSNNRFVTDSEKQTWNTKANTSLATTSSNGLMSASDKLKLDNLSSSPDEYIHPATHPVSMITGLHSVATSGNADTAIKLLTARTITIGNSFKNFDGSSGVSFTLADIGAAASSHTHTKAQITDFPSSLPANGGDATTLKGRDLCGELDSLKSSVSNGKQEIATAITGKGISASSSDSFTTLSTKISSITTGIDTSDATAMSSNILAGKTAYIKGIKVTGVMTYRGAAPITLTYPGESYTIPEGYHSGIGKINCSTNLYTATQLRTKMAALVYYTMHYAFDSGAMLNSPSIAFEMMEGAMQSSYLNSIWFNSNTTITLEGSQVLFIWGGGYVTNHSGTTNDECGSGKYRGYFFDDIGEEYNVTITNNNTSCYYYIFNF